MAKQSDHKATPYIIIDFETSGLDLKKNAITEIAAIGITGDKLEEIARFEKLIAPYGKQYDEGAEKITGLTQEFLLLNGEDFKEVVQEFVEFVIKCNVHNSKTGYKPMIIAHNPLFEVQCLQHLEKEGKMTPTLDKLFHGQFDYYGNYQPYYQDTITLAKYLWAKNERMTSYKLGDVMERASIQLNDGHRAMNDVKPTLEFLRMIINNLRGAEIGAVKEETELSFRKEFLFEF